MCPSHRFHMLVDMTDITISMWPFVKDMKIRFRLKYEILKKNTFLMHFLIWAQSSLRFLVLVGTLRHFHNQAYYLRVAVWCFGDRQGS